MADYAPILKRMMQPADTSGFRKQARADATADTQAQVGAFRQQQSQINQQAAGRARQINLAAIAASRQLAGQDLAGHLSAGIHSAAGDIAGLASGFSGDLRRTVGEQEAKVQQGLDAIGGPGGVPSTTEQAGNVVYGVGGQIPASALLQAAPFAEAATRAMPASLLGYGQQQAIGAIGQGREQAAQYDTDIASALAGRPKLERGYLADYTKAAQDQRKDQVDTVFDTIGVQQKEDDRTARIADDKADRKARVNAAKLTAAAKVEAAAVKAAADRADATAEQKADAEKLARPNASLSNANGYLTDGYGEAIPDANGNYRVLPGFQVNANRTGIEKIPSESSKPTVSTTLSAGNGYLTDTHGEPVLRGGKAIPYKAPAGAKSKPAPLTTGQKQEYTADINNTVAGLKAGGVDPKTGEELPKRNYAEALAFLRDQGYLTSPELKKYAMDALNRTYHPNAKPKAKRAPAAPKAVWHPERFPGGVIPPGAMS